jgi:EmrB/QacA subfamily drug resistance transporter
MAKLRSNPWAVLLVLCMGFFMILLDTTIVNIAIPSMIDSLQASLDQILWVLNSYILVYAVLLITTGRLGDLLGQRNLFAAGMAIFVVSSAFAGQAQDSNQLIAGRVLQGIGGALLTPQTMAIITTIFPPDRRGAAFGVWGGVAGIAAITGPTLGGFIVSNWTWRWIFYVNLPIGIVALVATFLIVPDIRPGRQHRFDFVGVGLATLGLFLIVFGLIEGEHYDWSTIYGPITVPLIIAAGMVVLVLFGFWERTREEPLVPFSLFRDRNYLMMNWIAAVVSFGMLGMFLPITIYLQSVLGLSPLNAGLTMVPMAITSMLIAPFSGRLVDKIGGKYILMAGLSLFALGMGLLILQAGPNSTWRTFLVPLLLAGMGQGFTFAPMTTVAMRDITPRMAGAASGVLNTTRQLGGVIGAAVVGAVLQNQLANSLRERAIQDASQLPPQFQQPFVEGFSNAVKSGLEVGRGQSGMTQQLPQGIPPQVVDTLQRLGHDVFVNGFIAAMKPTLEVSIVVLVLGVISTLAVVNTKKASAHAQAAHEQQHSVWTRAGSRGPVD